MTHDEFTQLEATRCTISIDQLMDKSPRTLLWGHTTDKRSWHVYIDNGLIRLYIYGGWGANEETGMLTSSTDWRPHDLVPDKRLYPEACDFEFCRLLTQCGVSLPFGVFNPKRPPQQYHGSIA